MIRILLLVRVIDKFSSFLFITYVYLLLIIPIFTGFKNLKSSVFRFYFEDSLQEVFTVNTKYIQNIFNSELLSAFDNTKFKNLLYFKLLQIGNQFFNQCR